MKFFFKHFNLQLFAEGGAGGAGDGSGAAAGAAPAAQADTSLANSQDAKNPLSHVVYGKPVAEEATQQPGGTEAGAPETHDREAEFKALIKGDYKEQYGNAVKAAVDARFKSTQEVVDKYNKAAPLFEMLAKKYGADAGDIDSIVSAVENDDSLYEHEALESGMTVQQLKEVKKMQRENADLKAQMEQQKMKEQSEQIFNRWIQESDEAKKLYPQLDLRTELNNPQFASLLRANIPVQTAYEVIHKDEIIPKAMQFAVKETERKITNSVIAGGRRPAESAASGASSAVVKTDVSQLTAADRREIERRVARGERISF